ARRHSPRRAAAAFPGLGDRRAAACAWPADDRGALPPRPLSRRFRAGDAYPAREAAEFMSPTILLPELAALLGRPGSDGERYLKRKHLELTERHGFPAKLVTGWAWPRKLVEIWIENSNSASGASQPAAEIGGAGSTPSSTGAA